MVVGTVLFVGAAVAAIAVGSVTVPPGEVVQSLAFHLGGLVADVADKLGVAIPRPAPPDSAVNDLIVWKLRVPRTLAAIVVGAALAIAGAALQAMVRNPLADPYVLGVSSGASLGAVLVMSSASALWLRNLGLPTAAFIGAMIALLIVLLFAHRSGTFTGSRIVLAGVGVGQVAAAATSLVQLHSDPAEIRGMLFWMMGSVAGVDSLSVLVIPAVVSLGCVALLMVQGRSLNAVSMGDDDAVALGVSVNAFRLQLIVVVALLTGVSVSIAGGVGFVGLMIPHIARFAVGADYRRLLPAAALLGAAFLVAVDTVARSVDPPNEYPLTIFTAAVGGPFFLWLLKRSRAGGAV
ncbi:FecCD family ABC transporter permease [Gordonia crocea]|uniref:ABC transporter permease n=1 Tax=Gordonia crocea TaxID=589162 RepID=A0A7I9UZE1_9ACTN|nr:iron ABC transporter permease [Gordonia crocea]GED98554.1 ABC transporter permease [Gordonia crocea]